MTKALFSLLKASTMRLSQSYDEAIRLNPNYPGALYNKGTVLAVQGKYDEAIKAFDKATRLDPKYAKAWNNKGWALNNQNKYDEAIKAFDKATSLILNLH